MTNDDTRRLLDAIEEYVEAAIAETDPRTDAAEAVRRIDARFGLARELARLQTEEIDR